MIDLGKIYCIHRSKDEERYTRLVKEIDRVNIDPIFVEPEKPIEKDYPKNMNSNMDSLRRTTIKLIENAIDKGYDKITIMEDDCVFIDFLWDMFVSSKLPEIFNFIHLNVTGHQVNGVFNENEIYVPLYSGECCQFYIIHKRIYKKYLELLKKHITPIDVITSAIHRKEKKSFSLCNNPVIHITNMYSTLRDKTVKY